jgi:hypothetical protein
MSLGLGQLDSDINTGVGGETLFFQEMGGQCEATVQKWEHFLTCSWGSSRPSWRHVGSDIGSVSQPLEATKACFK